MAGRVLAPSALPRPLRPHSLKAWARHLSASCMASNGARQSGPHAPTACQKVLVQACGVGTEKAQIACIMSVARGVRDSPSDWSLSLPFLLEDS